MQESKQEVTKVVSLVNNDGKSTKCIQSHLTLSVPNFRHLSSAFFILTNYRLERRLYVKLKD